MTKKEFKEKFIELTKYWWRDISLYEERVTNLANKISFTTDTIKEWFDGISLPVSKKRDEVIRYLYEEIEKEKMRNFVRDILSKELRIKFIHNNVIALYLGDEEISSDLISLWDDND